MEEILIVAFRLEILLGPTGLADGLHDLDLQGAVPQVVSLDRSHPEIVSRVRLQGDLKLLIYLAYRGSRSRVEETPDGQIQRVVVEVFDQSVVTRSAEVVEDSGAGGSARRVLAGIDLHLQASDRERARYRTQRCPGDAVGARVPVDRVGRGLVAETPEAMLGRIERNKRLRIDAVGAVAQHEAAAADVEQKIISGAVVYQTVGCLNAIDGGCALHHFD